MIDIIQYDFMRNAIAAGLLASLICGIVGTLVVVNRIVFLSGGIAHAAYGGIGMSFYFGWPYMLGTMGFSLAAAFTMALVTLRARHRADTVIGVIWAAGMSCGIILMDLTPGYHVDLMSYLFGSILAVPPSDLWTMAGVGGATLCLIIFFYNDFIALSYDEEYARVRGVPVKALYFTLIGMLAVVVVLMIQVVGLILVIALLTIPPFIMERHATSLFKMMIGSSFLGACFTLAGLWLSFTFNLTAGASIILVAAACFFLVVGFDYLLAPRAKRNNKRSSDVPRVRL